ncbi:substrate-binding domain-containing protein [Nocardia sp. NPDC059195]|uniref:substrate-binding domain-containing protein n=1 Tax=Nocardia sp. NPDC059195 TaxID=3346765 RepID=UPI0036B95B5C
MSDFPIEIVLSLIALAVAVATYLQQFVFIERKRLGYRVQMNTPASKIFTDPNGAPQANNNGTASKSVVLIRIENSGTAEIVAGDYYSSRPRLVFPAHTVHLIEVTERVNLQGRVDTGATLDAIQTVTRADGGSEIFLPAENLAVGEHYKVLAVLEGPVAAPDDHDGEQVVTHLGSIKSGTFEATPSHSSGIRPARALLGLSLFLAVVVTIQLVASIVRPEPLPDYCATGTLDLVGSTAMAPMIRKAAASFENHCPGAKFAFDFTGTTDGLEDLDAPESAPNTVAIGEGPKHKTFPDLSESAFAVAPFSVVVHPDLGVADLTTDQIQRLFRGQISNWIEIGGPDLPVVVVDREYGSGSRFAIEHRLLDWNRPLYQPEPCAGRQRLVHCEVRSTTAMADVVARNPGAVGYLESSAVRDAAIKSVKINGVEATKDNMRAKAYPFYSAEFAFNDYPGGQIPAESLAAKFIDYLTHGQGRLIVAEFGGIACVDWDVRTDCAP